MKKSFVLYADQLELLEDLNVEQKAWLLDALFSYACGNDVIPPDPQLKIIYRVFTSQIKRDKDKWDTRAERSRENGAKGGRPPNNPENPVGFSETQNNPENLVGPRKPVTVTVTANDTVKVTGKGNDGEIAFSSGEIQLTPQMLSEWRNIYHTVDIPAYLYQLESSKWFATQLASNRRWDKVCLASLNSQHQKNLAAQNQTKPKKRIVY
jgi:hypothetical protein